MKPTSALGWLFAIFILLGQAGLAQANPDTIHELSPDQMQSGSLLLRMKSGYRIASRLNTDIKLNVSGLVARVTVSQEFQNDGAEWVEGVYVFPLPEDAAVDQLRMRIGERFIEGEIREKAQAKKEYEQAKRAGKKASLVQQHRANLFRTSVANIGPGEAITIEIEYLQNLHYDDGTFSLRFPLTITPRYIPGTSLPDRKGSGWSPDSTQVQDASLITPPMVARSKDHKVTLHGKINAGVPLATLTSRYHPIDVASKNDFYEVNLANGPVPMDHDIELTWRPVPSESPRPMIFSETFDGHQHLLMMILPPNKSAADAPIMPRDLTFVVDTSGSMHGTSMTQAKQSLNMALDGLKPTDRFNVIQFNSTPQALFQQSVPADLNNIARAKRYVARLNADGGTEMHAALKMALSGVDHETHLRQIVFITDGSVGNEEALFTVINNDLGNARLFTVGIGSAPNGLFMRKAAEIGHGTFTYVSAQHEVQEKMARLIHKLEQPQLTNIEIQWPSGLSATTYPETVADLYAGEPVVIKARLSNTPRASDLLTITGDSAAGSWSKALDFATDRNSLGVAAIWARAKIEMLADNARRGADHEETRQAIVATALLHHLVSKHTSLVAVDKTPTRPLSKKLGKEQIASLLPYGQSHEAIFGFPAGATTAPLRQLIGMLSLLTVFMAWALRRRLLTLRKRTEHLATS
jgi:Ca-activated chloride channel family protein